MDKNNQNELIDPKVYKTANRRVHFKMHLAIYVLAMLVLWIVYFFLFKATQPVTEDPTVAEVVNGGMTFLKLNILITALWSVLIIFHGLFVYKFNSSMLEKEIKSLQKEIKKQESLKKELLERQEE